MLIKDLKDKYPLVYEAAVKNCNPGRNENDTILSAFIWANTPEDHNFWSSIVSGQFNKAKKICPHLFVESPVEFKVDDWVVVLPTDEYYFNAEKDKAQKITEVYEGSYLPYQLPFSDGKTNTYRHIRKATQAEIDKATGVKEETMFRKGDYIVTLKVPNGYNCAKKNYCFKIRIDHKGIYPEIDLKGSKSNGHDILSFDKKESLLDWRYATPEEIAEYDRLDKPYDVTTLNTKTKSTDMKAIQEEAKRRFPIGCRFRCIDGDEFKLINDDIVYKIMNNMIYASDGLGCLYNDGTWAELISMPKTKQTYTVDELVVGEVYVESNPGWNYHYILQIGETEHSRLEIDNDSGNVKRFAYSELKSASRGCSYRKATTDEIQLLNEHIFKPIKTSTLGELGGCIAPFKTNKYKAKTAMVADIWPVESPKPLLLNKPTKQKQLVNLK
jgi:hypothetical protein